MKYNPEDYLYSGFYDCEYGDDVECHKEKLVKCRKPHECMGGCEKEIAVGEYALLETGFLDGKPVSSYTCLPCIEAWLEKSGQVGFDNGDGEQDER